MLVDSPWAYTASPEDDVALDLDRVRAMFADEGAATFAIEALESPADLVAAASIRREMCAKFAHRALLWGVFVEPKHRGHGWGRAVVTAAVDAARAWPGVDYVDLAVSANAPAAQRLYEVWGSRRGVANQSTEHEGRRYDEIYMTLRRP
jgi:ribosomal protein S18 acetylase RimI-like enzyme